MLPIPVVCFYEKWKKMGRKSIAFLPLRLSCKDMAYVMATLTILVEDNRVIMICLKSWEYERIS